jgi:uncharacterized protein YaaQ
MKLVIAVVQEKDKHKVMDVLLRNDYKFTHVASTGGFLREGNVTFFIGVEPDRLDHVTSLIGESSKTREQYVSVFPPTVEPIGAVIPTPIKVKIGGAVIFVLEVESFNKL